MSELGWDSAFWPRPKRHEKKVVLDEFWKGADSRVRHAIEYELRCGALADSKPQSVADLTYQELMLVPNCGKATIAKINNCLSAVGLKITSKHKSRWDGSIA